MRFGLRYLALFSLGAIAIVGVGVGLTTRPRIEVAAAEPVSKARAKLDPAAWGGDHVGQELPEFVDSGECLFCHRNDVGPTWAANKHSQTIRDARPGSPVMQALDENQATKPLAGDVQLIVGDTRAIRFLRRSSEYGRLDLLSVLGRPTARGNRYQLSQTENPHWDTDLFARGCAGCHTTAVDSETSTFTTVSIDCFACHGTGPLEHANDAKLMPLAKDRHDTAMVVSSICGQCHIRSGEAKSTGLPYPNHFVAGDNLFKDYQVDWNVADDPQLNPGDRHVLDNLREVVLFGNEQLTCLSCHEVHQGTSIRHRTVPDQAYCQHCHEPGKSKKEHLHYEVHSRRCQY